MRLGWAPLLALIWGGCRCGDGAEQAPMVPEASHFGTFHGLVNAAVRGDVEGARWIARSLTEGDVPDPPDDGGGAQAVGGGLGFIQMAEDSSEVNDGLAAAAVGCGQCHLATAVSQPPMGPWTHENAGLRMVLGAVFPPIQPPPVEPEPLGEVRAAWDGATGEADQLAAALTACSDCHRK